MRVICAWCGKDMGEKEGGNVEGASHSICDQCAQKLLLEMKQILKEEDGPWWDSQDKNGC